MTLREPCQDGYSALNGKRTYRARDWDSEQHGDSITSPPPSIFRAVVLDMDEDGRQVNLAEDLDHHRRMLPHVRARGLRKQWTPQTTARIEGTKWLGKEGHRHIKSRDRTSLDTFWNARKGAIARDQGRCRRQIEQQLWRLEHLACKEIDSSS